MKIKKICSKCHTERGGEWFGPQWEGRLGLKARCYRCVRGDMYEKVYGVGVEWFEERLAEQGNCCAVCWVGFPINPYLKTSPHVDLPILDHDRMTGRPRGVVCGKCCTALGILEEDPDLLRGMIKYFRTWVT